MSVKVKNDTSQIINRKCDLADENVVGTVKSCGSTFNKEVDSKVNNKELRLIFHKE